MIEKIAAHVVCAKDAPEIMGRRTRTLYAV